jgi:toxin-antitoxin system PIN domain toxin
VTFLLDVNVLVALFDAAHAHHDAAHRWFGSVGRESWATCPITENGLVRVLSNPSYPTVSASVADVSERLRVFCSQPGHIFWSDDVSLRDDTRFDLSRLRGHKQITDLYLAALAARQGGKLATFDTAIPCHALIGGTDDLVELIPLA